jgi:electron transport complex protein RnfC
MGLATFKGGIHPPDKKTLAANSPMFCKPPKIAVIPLSQHIGALHTCFHRTGSQKGEVVGEAGGLFISCTCLCLREGRCHI